MASSTDSVECHRAGIDSMEEEVSVTLVKVARMFGVLDTTNLRLQCHFWWTGMELFRQ